MATRFVIGGPLRLLTGLVLAGVAGLLVDLGHRLGWGMAGLIWVLAAVLLLPAFQLVRRIVLVADGGHIDLESGFLFRRSWRFALAGGELEIVPTAGLRTVVLHKGGHEIPLAAWLTGGRAEALCAFIDAAPGGPLPRRAPRRPEADR
jgi:hypothetical protein